MNRAISHDRAIEELEIVALGAAPPETSASMAAHAADCDACRRELDDLTLVLTDLTDLIPDRPLNRGRSAGIRSRLMARADADADTVARRRVAAAPPGRTRVTPVPSGTRVPIGAAGAAQPAAPAAESRPAAGRQAAPQPAPRARRMSGTTVWALVATAGLLVAGALLLRGYDDREAAPFADTPEPDIAAARADSLETVLREREAALEVFASRDLRIVSLTNWTSVGRPLARMFWNPGTHRWTLLVYEIRPPRPGRTYQVWLVTAGDRRVSVGTFHPLDDGTATMTATRELEPGLLRSITITEEPLDGSPQPTGPVLLAGTGP